MLSSVAMFLTRRQHLAGLSTLPLVISPGMLETYGVEIMIAPCENVEAL